MKNLTQLPWSGKGSKAKNDNTLGRMRGGIRSRIGSMSLKNTSLFGVILTLLLTLGVGEMWGADVQKNAIIYMDNSAANWSYSNIYFVINNTNGYPMTAVANTKLYVHKRSANTWSGYSNVRFFAATVSWGGDDASMVSESNMASYGANLTNTQTNYGFTGDRFYVIKLDKAGTITSSSTRANLTTSYIGTAYTSMNKTITVKAKVSTDGGSTYSEATSPGTLSASSKTFSNYSTCGTSTSLSSGTISCGYTATTTLTAADATGYDFVGWYNSSGTQQTTSKTLTIYPTANATYYAYYKEKQYSLTFSHNGHGSIAVGGNTVSSGSTANVNYFTTKTLVATPSDGYHFSGWSLSGTNTGSVTIGSTSSASTTIKATNTGATVTALFEEDASEYDVTFGVGTSYTSYGSLAARNTTDGVDLSSGDDVAAGKAITFTASPNTGYEVAGFYSDASCSSSLQSGNSTTYSVASLSGDLTVYVKFQLIDYTVTYKDQGNVAYSGSNGGSLTTVYHYGTGIASLTAGIKSGYTFGGWFDNSECTGSAITSISSTATGNKTFYAKWTENMTTVTINVNPTGAGTLTVGGGAFTPGSTTTAGVSTSRTVVATANSGKIFLDWSTSGNATGTSSTNTYTLKGNGSGSTGTLTANFGIASGWYIEGTAFGGWVRPNTATYQFARPYRGMENVFYYPASLAASSYWKVNDGTKPYSISNSTTAITKKTIYSLTEEWSNSTYASSAMTNIWVVLDKSNKKLWVQDPQTYYNVNVSGANDSKGPVKVTLKTTSAITLNSNVLETTQFANGETFTVTVTGVSGWIPTITIGGTPTTFWKEADTYEATGTMSTSDIAVNITYTASRALTFSTTTGCATLTATGPGSTNVTSGTKIKDGTSITFAQTASTGYSFSKWYSTSTGEGGTQYSTADSYTLTTSSSANTIYPIYTLDSYTITLDRQTGATGYGSSGTAANPTATYNAVLPAISGSMPAGTGSYGFMGFYTGTLGTGLRLTDASGAWIASVEGYTDADKKWIHAGDVTLYAYYKQAEISELTPAPAIIAPGETVTVTPTLSPAPAGTHIICWELQYSNGTARPSQPTFTPGVGNAVSFPAPSASATYRIQATLRSGASCGGGSVLSTRAATFQVAGDHTVTVQYKCGDMTIAESVELDEIKPLIWSDGITAPSITGYTFSGWVAGDGVTIKEGESSTATTHIKATYDGTLTANYTRKRMIYFYNTLNWGSVYVYFYKDANYWDNSNGTGTDPSYFSGSHAAAHKGQMLPITEGSKIYYFDAEAISIPSGYTNVAFTEKQQDNCWYFYDNNKVIRRSDYKSTTMPLFVPLADQTPVNKNGNTAKYYNEGYWMNYPENSGYTLKIYDSQGASTPTRTIRFPYSEDLKMPLKLDVDLNDASRDYYYTIYREDGTVLSANYNMNINYHTDVRLNDSSKKIKITTTASGIYTFTLVYKDNGGTKDYYISVDYPIGTNDYRVWYSDNAAWSGAAHTGSWYHASDIINKNANAEVTQYDTVSFYIAKGDGITTSMKFQYASNIEESGSVTWTDVVSGGITLSSYSSVITKAGVYNFIIKQVGTATPVVEKVEPYTGNYYIRTDCAGDTKWDSYKTADHHMTYSDYAENNSGYSHYYAHWVTNGSNVKFCIANDFSASITDTLVQDYGTTIANINAGGYLASGEAHNANIRFMWNQSTNKLSRAYIAGSGNITDRFLVLEGDAKMYDENGNALTGEHQDHDQYGTKLGTDNQVIMHDDENFVYERTIQVNTKASAKLTAKYNNNIQYFIGGASETVELLGGETSPTKYTMRIVYDFKTNRLVTAYMPSDAAITENLAINADIMLVREHQNAGQQLTFEGKGSLSKVKTVYGVMRFNRWTLNNKSTAAGHALVGDPKSTYERSLYWISFPFDVNLSDVFGFGTYGTHWIIEYYDGAERAKEGYWKDSEGFWKYITNRRGVKLEAGKGYILALDLDLMRDNNTSFWANNIEQVELFFPSAAAVENIEKTDTEIDIPAHECTIAPRPGQTDDRRKKDSHWNIIGVPSYANYGSTLKNGSDATITWNDDPETKNLPFLYEWNMVDNSYSVQSGTTYPFKSMHAYMVQYFGKIKWSLASATPSPVVARHADAPQDVEFRLELQAGEKVADQTFVKMTTDEQISTAFDFNYDLSKQMNSGKANIYTMVEGYIQTAGNCLPMSEQTTVVPVGVKIAADGDYTFAIPDGTEGVGVTLIDQETGIRTSLSALAYTVSLEAGTYDERFVLEISPIHNVPTEQSAVRDQQADVRKVLIDGLLYIVRDNKMYDARGAMIMEK